MREPLTAFALLALAGAGGVWLWRRRLERGSERFDQAFGREQARDQ